MLFEPRPAAAFHVMRRRGHPMRLLLVEDDPDLGGDLRDALTREGFVVALVADGLDAWFLGGTEDFALALRDLGLPRLDGLRILACWREGGPQFIVLVQIGRARVWERVCTGVQSCALPIFHVMRRRGHPVRLLLVEYDPDLGGDLRDALTREGFVVDLVADGLDAWFHGGTEDFALAILDLGLPRLDGLSILKRWREEGRNFPVLVLTARGDWTEKVEGIEAGADDYVAKP